MPTYRRATGILVGLSAGTIVALLSVAPAAQGSRALDATGPISYFIADGSGRAGYRPSDRQLAEWALANWRRAAGGPLMLRPSSEDEAIVRVYWADPDGGQYGEMRPLEVGGRRGAAVFIRPDVNALGEEIASRSRTDTLLRDTIVYLTCLHELGHALGLSHTDDFADIMYFFGYGGNVVDYFMRYRRQLHARNDIATTSGLSSADQRRLRSLYPTPAGR